MDRVLAALLGLVVQEGLDVNAGERVAAVAESLHNGSRVVAGEHVLRRDDTCSERRCTWTRAVTSRMRC